MKSEKQNRETFREEEKKKRMRRKRRRRSDLTLWDVIVNDDDICFQHILPRLQRNDVKFLYEVNAETRAMIKRSSRKSELKTKFRVEEMSSISTLEIAWNNVRWGEESFRLEVVMDQAWFCWNVARTNKLELLEWAREVKNCDWDAKTSGAAAYHGNLEMAKYCVANGCPVNELACARAAGNGDLECLKYLHEDVKAPWDWRTGAWAASNGHLHILEYLFERKYKFGARSCEYAAEEDQLECLKYLHEVAKARWTSSSIKTVVDRIRFTFFGNEKRLECLRYLLDNDCPLGDFSRERLLRFVANGGFE